jgi:hypothetical protein
VQAKDDIQGFHKTSWKGILKIVKSRKSKYAIPLVLCILLTIVIILIVNRFNADTYKLVTNLSELSISIFSSLLGFSLGGYALIIGFSNNSLIEKTSKTNGYSTYQLLSGFFAYTIIIQLATLAISFIIKLISNQNIEQITKHFSSQTCNMINLGGFSLILFLSLYSLILCPFIVTNLFTLGQLNNFYYTIEKLKEKKKDKEPTIE